MTQIWLGVVEKQRLYVFGGTAAVAETAVAQARLRHWDHQALADLPLWSQCPPEQKPAFLEERENDFDVTWANWDTQTTLLTTLDGDFHVASGWWTGEQIDRWLPRSGITAETAYEHARYIPSHDHVTLWPIEVIPRTHIQESPDRPTTLRAAMQHRGNDLSSYAEMTRTTRYGIAGSGAWPDSIRVGLLLTDWKRWQYALPPTTQEPVAWPLDTLFEQHESSCVGEALIEMCDSGQTPSPMLASDHPIGRVLRSVACGEKNEADCFVIDSEAALACVRESRS